MSDDYDADEYYLEEEVLSEVEHTEYSNEPAYDDVHYHHQHDADDVNKHLLAAGAYYYATAEHRSSGRQSSNYQTSDCQSSGHQSSGHQSSSHQSSGYHSSGYHSSDNQSSGNQSNRYSMDGIDTFLTCVGIITTFIIIPLLLISC